MYGPLPTLKNMSLFYVGFNKVNYRILLFNINQALLCLLKYSKIIETLDLQFLQYLQYKMHITTNTFICYQGQPFKQFYFVSKIYLGIQNVYVNCVHIIIINVFRKINVAILYCINKLIYVFIFIFYNEYIPRVLLYYETKVIVTCSLMLQLMESTSCKSYRFIIKQTQEFIILTLPIFKLFLLTNLTFGNKLLIKQQFFSINQNIFLKIKPYIY